MADTHIDALCCVTMLAILLIVIQPIASIGIVPLLVVLYHAAMAQTMVSTVERLLTQQQDSRVLTQKLAAMVLLQTPSSVVVHDESCEKTKEVEVMEEAAATPPPV